MRNYCFRFVLQQLFTHQQAWWTTLVNRTLLRAFALDRHSLWKPYVLLQPARKYSIVMGPTTEECRSRSDRQLYSNNTFSTAIVQLAVEETSMIRYWWHFGTYRKASLFYVTKSILLINILFCLSIIYSSIMRQRKKDLKLTLLTFLPTAVNTVKALCHRWHPPGKRIVCSATRRKSVLKKNRKHFRCTIYLCRASS